MYASICTRSDHFTGSVRRLNSCEMQGVVLAEEWTPACETQCSGSSWGLRELTCPLDMQRAAHLHFDAGWSDRPVVGQVRESRCQLLIALPTCVARSAQVRLTGSKASLSSGSNMQQHSSGIRHTTAVDGHPACFVAPSPLQPSSCAQACGPVKYMPRRGCASLR